MNIDKILSDEYYTFLENNHNVAFYSLSRNELSRTFYQKNKQQYYLLHYACCVCHLAV